MQPWGVHIEAVPTKETTGAAWAQDLPDRREALLPRMAGYFMALAERAWK